MSSPPNPLDVYRTYSYHHILVACDSTDTAEALNEELEITKFDHPDTKFCPQTHSSGGKYIVLVNGMTDAQFFIKSAKWSTVPIPTSSSTTASSVTSVQTMAVDGEIVISEPQGVNFFNVLVQSTKMLGIDPVLITFVLKTIFIGHRHDGVETMITNLKPLMFMMVDITAQIDVAGAEYTMALVGLANGVGKMPHTNSIVTGFPFNVAEDLKKTMVKLQKDINDKYEKMWGKLRGGKSSCGVVTSPDMFDSKFSKVIYKIDLSSAYASYDVGTIKDPKFRDSTKKGGYVANLGPGASIENIISAIMMTSKMVIDEARGKLPNDRFMFKISSSVKTDPSTATMTITYHIDKFKATVVKTEEALTFEPPDGTGITFDYIFTGKNIDVKDFDIKMEYGLMFFQVLSVQGSNPTAASHMIEHYNPDVNIKASGPDERYDGKDSTTLCDDAKGKGGIKKPLFLGTTIKHPLFRDTTSIGGSASFNNLLHRHAAIENLGVKLTIRGNPQLLSDTNQLPSEMATIVNKVPEVIVPEGAGTIESELRSVMPNIQRQPAYVKVNVWSPKSWTGSSDKSEIEKSASYEGDYAENLWYDGWYYMLQIDNIFEGGEFSQVLELMSLPVESGDVETLDECLEGDEGDISGERKEGGAGHSPPKVTPSKIAAASNPHLNPPKTCWAEWERQREARARSKASKDKKIA